jgi:hypothetical protein
LVHRDVKPGNVLIAAASGPPEDGHVYLSDFGLTKRTSSDSGLTATGQFVGTLDYAAPEQFEGKPLDARTDEYSLGCVLFECLTGEPPYVRENDAAVMYAHLMAPTPKVSEHRPDLPPAIDAVVTTAMAKDPGDRYASAGLLAAAAADALDVSTTAPTTRPGGPLRQRMGLLAGGVIGLLVIAAIVGGFLLWGGSTPAATPTTHAPPPQAGGQLARIDPVTGTVLGRFDVGASATAVAVGEGAVWVVDEQEQKVVRVDPSSGRVVAKIAVGKEPAAIAVGEGGIWVADSADGIVERIDPATNSVVARIRVQEGVALVAAAGGSVVAAGNASTLSIDPDSNEVSAIDGPGATNGLTAGDGAIWWVHASQEIGFSIYVKPNLYRFDVDAERGVFIGTFIKTSGGVVGVRPLAVGNGTAWEPVFETNNQIRPMDTATGRPGRIITVGPYPGGLALDGVGGLWVLNQGDGTVWKVSTASGQSVAVVPVGQRVMGIAADSQGVWVTLEPSGA